MMPPLFTARQEGAIDDMPNLSGGLGIAGAPPVRRDLVAMIWTKTEERAYDIYSTQWKRLFFKDEGHQVIRMGIKDILHHLSTMQALRAVRESLHVRAAVSKNAGHFVTYRRSESEWSGDWR